MIVSDAKKKKSRVWMRNVGGEKEKREKLGGKRFLMYSKVSAR